MNSDLISHGQPPCGLARGTPEMISATDSASTIKELIHGFYNSAQLVIKNDYTGDGRCALSYCLSGADSSAMSIISVCSSDCLLVLHLVNSTSSSNLSWL